MSFLSLSLVIITCHLCRVLFLLRSDSSVSFFFFFFVFFFQVAVYIIQAIGIPRWGNRSVETSLTQQSSACWMKVWRCDAETVVRYWQLLSVFMCKFSDCAWVSEFFHSCLCLGVFLPCFSLLHLWQIPALLTCLGCCFVSVEVYGFLFCIVQY